MAISKRFFFKSITIFILNEVAEDSKESPAELYDRWRIKNGLVIKDPELAAWTLEYFARAKNFDRYALRDAAIIDGFIAK